jgi:hypothetical protein
MRPGALRCGRLSRSTSCQRRPRTPPRRTRTAAGGRTPRTLELNCQLWNSSVGWEQAPGTSRPAASAQEVTQGSQSHVPHHSDHHRHHRRGGHAAPPLPLAAPALPLAAPALPLAARSRSPAAHRDTGPVPAARAVKLPGHIALPRRGREKIMTAIKAAHAAPRQRTSPRNGLPEPVPYVYGQQTRRNTYAARIARRNIQGWWQPPAALPGPKITRPQVCRPVQHESTAAVMPLTDSA